MKITLNNGVCTIEAAEDELGFLSAAVRNMNCELCEQKSGCGKYEISPYCKRMTDIMDDALFLEGADSERIC